MNNDGISLLIRDAYLFVCVGFSLMLLDVLVFRKLVNGRKWNRYLANILSTSIALSASVIVNRHIVFRPETFDTLSGIGRFLLITIAAAWGIQNFVLWWLANDNLSTTLIRSFIKVVLRSIRTDQEVVSETVLHKLIACAVAMIWNFCWYEWWVFA